MGDFAISIELTEQLTKLADSILSAIGKYDYVSVSGTLGTLTRSLNTSLYIHLPVENICEIDPSFCTFDNTLNLKLINHIFTTANPIAKAERNIWEVLPEIHQYEIDLIHTRQKLILQEQESIDEFLSLMSPPDAKQSTLAAEKLIDNMNFPKDENNETHATIPVIKYMPAETMILYVPESHYHIKLEVTKNNFIQAGKNIVASSVNDSHSLSERYLQTRRLLQNENTKSLDSTIIHSKYRAGTIHDILIDPADEPSNAHWEHSIKLHPNWVFCQPKTLSLEDISNSLFELIEKSTKCIKQIVDFSGQKNVISDQLSSLGLYVLPTASAILADQTAQHYNLKKIESARFTSIEALRKLNNHVKRLLITLAKQLFSQDSNVNVLDLACGHGQDCYKYIEAGILSVYGIDISSEEIKEAQTRCRRLSVKEKLNFHFVVGDITNSMTFELLPTFELVSFQLAIHYCISSSEEAAHILSMISQRLKSNGIFIGSTGCCETIARRLARSGKISNDHFYEFKNQYYKIQFPKNAIDKLIVDDSENKANLENYENQLIDLFSNQWGILYNFELIDHLNAKEFIIPWTAFEKIASSYGLKLLYAAPFEDIFLEGKSSRLPCKHNNYASELYHKADQAQKEILNFYTGFVFIKTESSIEAYMEKLKLYSFGQKKKSISQMSVSYRIKDYELQNPNTNILLNKKRSYQKASSLIVQPKSSEPKLDAVQLEEELFKDHESISTNQTNLIPQVRILADTQNNSIFDDYVQSRPNLDSIQDSNDDLLSPSSRSNTHLSSSSPNNSQRSSLMSSTNSDDSDTSL